MSTMQSELQKVFAEWEREREQDASATGVKAPEGTNLTAQGPKRFGVTNNVTRTTFNYVRDNPGCTRKEAIDALEAQGFKQASTTSLLSVMVKQRLFREAANGTLFANVTEYVPLVQSQKKKKAVAKTRARVRVEAIPVAAPIAVPVEKRAQLIMHRTAHDMDKYIDTLNVRQAKILMQKLKDIFGEGV